jgi:hypothetical protein
MDAPVARRCLSCGARYSPSGSGYRQKYCPKCARKGVARNGGFSASNLLKTKAAKSGFEYDWGDRLSRLEMEGPIALLIGDELWRLWPGTETKKADARHWRLSVKGVRDAATPPPPRKDKPTSFAKGFRVRLMLEMEAPNIGCGNRLVTVQFRTVKRNKRVERVVVLHCAGHTDTIRRDVFKRLVASNRRYRKRNPLTRIGGARD